MVFGWLYDQIFRREETASVGTKRKATDAVTKQRALKKARKSLAPNAWEEKYEQLVKYGERSDGFDNLENDDPELAKWVKHQVERSSCLTLDHKDLLDEIGILDKKFKSTSKTAKPTSPGQSSREGKAKRTYKKKDFDDMMDRLIAFKEKHGHTAVGNNCEDEELFSFCHNQRQKHSKRKRAGEPLSTKRDADQIARLNSIDFQWVLQRGRKKGFKVPKKKIDG